MHESRWEQGKYHLWEMRNFRDSANESTSFPGFGLHILDKLPMVVQNVAEAVRIWLMD